MEITTKLRTLRAQLREAVTNTPDDTVAISKIENEISSIETTEIPFTVSARTARLIGQENFSNAEGAIIELVKNSYDADASVCVIIIDPINNQISVLDNGDGMTIATIKNHWMTIGTDDKRNNFRTKTRIKTGAKGIGRFALDRLGRSSVMTTKTLDSDCLIWEVDWNQFDSRGAVISDIKAKIRIGDESFSNKLIEIQELSGTHSGFSDFWIESKGTLISINSLNDVWDTKSTESLFGNLEVLVPPIETNTFEIFLYSTLEPHKYGRVFPTICDDYDYKLTAIADENQSVKITINRNELNYNELKANDYFHKLNQPQYQIEVFELGSFQIDTTLHTLLAGFKDIDLEKNLEKIGPFTFAFYFMKRGGGQERDDEVSKYPYKSVNYSSRTSWLDKFGGIKIFRDNFRVRPYGEAKSSSFDWLDLGKRALSNPTVTRPGYRVRPQQVYGIVNISRIGNVNFEDKSSREGLQENESFALFKEIVKSIIEIFENDRNQIMMTLKRVFDETNKKRQAQEEADRIIKNQQKNQHTATIDEQKQEKDTLIHAIAAYKEDLEELQDEQKTITSFSERRINCDLLRT